MNVQLKIRNLDGVQLQRTRDFNELLADVMIKYFPSYEESMSELVTVIQVHSDSHPLSLPVHEQCRSLKFFCGDNDWITLPVKYCDLNKDSVITVNIYQCDGALEMKPMLGTSVSLFDSDGILRSGSLHLKMIKNKVVSSKLTSDDLYSDKELLRLMKCLKEYYSGDMIKVHWLDKLMLSKVHRIKENEVKNMKSVYLTIEFPEFVSDDQPVTVVYYEESEDIIQVNTGSDIIQFMDAETLQENLIDNKYHILSRNLRSCKLDKSIKPNSRQRNMLQTVIRYPSMKLLTNDEKDLIWKYRYFLCNESKALIKFLNSISWKISTEVAEAMNLLSIWTPLNAEDALLLLTPNFKHPDIRKYAVRRLNDMTDDVLLLYMLQLVQALKYENPDVFSRNFCEVGGKEISVFEEYCKNEVEDLASFLIYRSCQNFVLANNFYWFLIIECESNQNDSLQCDSEVRYMYIKVLETFLKTLESNILSQTIHECLRRELKFVDDLVKVMKTVFRESGNRIKKTQKLQSVLNESEGLKRFEPMPFLLDPHVVITGIIPDKCDLFKSSLMPLKLTFTTSTGSEYTAIFKYGDDLRQDQLVLQIIMLIDKIFSNENFDLKLTPYHVLPASTKYGFIQYIQSFPVSQVLANYGSIQNFLRKFNPSETGPYGIAVEVMDTYIKSCAGYCVITYLLGVGDRHLDNLLLRTSGNIFHIDFGYILGRDPKPLAPPMKLSKEMVEAMGGMQSKYFNEFCKLCYTAFIYLRQHSDIILNVFSLMIDSGITDIALEPDKIVMKIQNKLKLDLSDDEAVCHFKKLLHVSVTAMFPVIVEQIHKFTQYWKK